MLVSTLSNDIAIVLGVAFLGWMLWLLFCTPMPDDAEDDRAANAVARPAQARPETPGDGSSDRPSSDDAA